MFHTILIDNNTNRMAVIAISLLLYGVNLYLYTTNTKIKWKLLKWAALSSGTVWFGIQSGSDVLSLWLKPSCATIQINATEQYSNNFVFTDY